MLTVAMDRPCIVCQENCPVSPKAIFTRELFNTVRIQQPLLVKYADNNHIEFQSDVLVANRYATGDYFCIVPDSPERQSRQIIANTSRA